MAAWSACLGAIAAELANAGHLNERGQPYAAQSIKGMLIGLTLAGHHGLDNVLAALHQLGSELRARRPANQQGEITARCLTFHASISR